eukprot:CAMPEP_0177796314 /NCGR_PEP_ID=MMETSP0491_2-20121128/26713_1 /TAXON_ID=63592 /ORGANISM="Tetraselmis chuii, Strain PLY429" /LENGTH=140 /DNA_ID=CAMNT_0019319229 /DNA_START=360 /DNA_END=783 /DNA_ORIENTATION=+
MRGQKAQRARALQPFWEQRQVERAEQQPCAARHLSHPRPPHMEGGRAGEVPDAPGPTVRVHVQEPLLDAKVRNAGSDVSQAYQRVATPRAAKTPANTPACAASGSWLTAAPLYPGVDQGVMPSLLLRTTSRLKHPERALP